MGELASWLTLMSVKGLGERSIKLLIQKIGDPVSVLDADEETLRAVVGPVKARAVKERRGVDESKIRAVEMRVREEGIGFLTLTDPNYPGNLRSIPDPPPVVFYMGELRNTPLVGVVGPRRPSLGTLSLVEGLVAYVLRSGYGTVSGGAPGVDIRVHMATVERSGYTLCVLGSGILKAGRHLLRLVERSNAVLLSELTPDAQATRYTFPRRNRIIAALSELLIVPEAGQKSGSLITAGYAFRYGKKIYAYIGENNSRWEGCRRLVSEGKALPFSDPREVFGEVERDHLLELLRRPRTFEEIREFLKLPPERLMDALTRLEIEGKVRREGPFYTAC